MITEVKKKMSIFKMHNDIRKEKNKNFFINTAIQIIHCYF